MLDSLNKHKLESLTETFGPRKAAKLLRRIAWHYTTKHASWLNLAENEFSAMTHLCRSQRFATINAAQNQLHAWAKTRNRKRIRILWKSRNADTKNVFSSLYARKKLAGRMRYY